MPFEIRNYRFEKGSSAYIYIHFNGTNTTLYDIFWDIWLNKESLTREARQVKKELHNFVVAQMGDNFDKLDKCIRSYVEDTNVNDPDEEEAMTCSYYNIDSCYEDVIEYLLDSFVRRSMPEFRYFNHVNYGVSMWYDNSFEKELYIDQLLGEIFRRLSKFGISPSGIKYVQVVGTCELLGKLNSFYDFNGDVNREKRDKKVKQHLEKMTKCYKQHLANILQQHHNENKALPIFFDENDYVFVMSCLQDDAL